MARFLLDEHRRDGPASSSVSPHQSTPRDRGTLAAWTSGPLRDATRAGLAHREPGVSECHSPGLSARPSLLFYWRGLSQSEIAAELGISLGAVKSGLHQARAALEPKLSPLVPPWWLRMLNTSNTQGDGVVAPDEKGMDTFVPEDDLRLVPEIVPADLLRRAMDTSRRALDEGTVPAHLQEWLNEDTMGRLQRIVEEQHD